MLQLQEFFINNWMLWLAFFIIIIVLIRLESSNHVRGIFLLSPQESVNMINREGAVVVDIRDHAAFVQGHIIDALNIPLADFEQHLEQLEKHKGAPIVLACDTGQRAIRAGQILRKHGFDKVNNLKGGLQAWKMANLPLSKSIE